MEAILLKQVTVTDPSSSFHNKIVDIRIVNGVITEIEADLTSSGSNETIVQSNAMHVSQGWVDMRAQFSDPGNEEKETLRSGLETASRGGFTGVVLSPLTTPKIQSKADISYLRNNSANQPTEIIPAVTLSKDAKGEDLNELFDASQAGALLFTDDKKATQNPLLVKLALQYTQGFGGVVGAFPVDEQLANGAQINESPQTAHLGLKGQPSLAESLRVHRDVHIQRYVGGKLFISPITTGTSIHELKNAQEEVSAATALPYLLYDDARLEGLNSHYKTSPPIRAKEDRNALIEALKTGTIQCICSDHTPQNIEEKKREFEHADYGMIGLQTFYSSLNKEVIPAIGLEQFIACITDNPRHILSLPTHPIEVGANANLTIFDTTITWEYTTENNTSLSENSPELNTAQKGKVIGIVNRGLARIFD